jgi:5S rRNA maturation endonuclease (ribonuclease M5)
MNHLQYTTDSLKIASLSAFDRHNSKSTKQSVIIVEGHMDITWLKSTCEPKRYAIREVAGKQSVLEYASSCNHLDEYACFVVDLDLDFLKRDTKHHMPKVVYNCYHISTNLHYNDIEIFQINSTPFETLLYEQDTNQELDDVNDIRMKLEKASRVYGSYYAAYEITHPSTKKPSFLHDLDPTNTAYFSAHEIGIRIPNFEERVEKWLKYSTRLDNFAASRVIAVANELNAKHPEPWRLSRGHTAIKMFTAYLMNKYPHKFSDDPKYAYEDVSSMLRKIGVSDVSKLPLVEYVQLRR